MNGQLHRVVVTGIGVVSPVGNTLEETWNNLVNGVCGIAPITLFDTTDYKAKVAGEVKNFEPRDYMTKQEILRSRPFHPARCRCCRSGCGRKRCHRHR